MNTAQALVTAAEIWLMIGAGVAAAFLIVGVDRIDEDARGAYAYRPLLIPGVLMIWPLVVWRWAILELGRNDEARRYQPPRAAHGVVAAVMAVVIPLTLIIGLSLRQSWPDAYAPVQISAPEASQ